MVALTVCLFVVCLFVCVYTAKAVELTELGKGKHHIGDFLPPEELDKFIERVTAIKEGRTPGGWVGGWVWPLCTCLHAYSGTSVKGHPPNIGQDSEHTKSHFPIIVLLSYL